MGRPGRPPRRTTSFTTRSWTADGLPLRADFPERFPRGGGLDRLFRVRSGLRVEFPDRGGNGPGPVGVGGRVRLLEGGEGLVGPGRSGPDLAERRGGGPAGILARVAGGGRFQ